MAGTWLVYRCVWGAYAWGMSEPRDEDSYDDDENVAWEARFGEAYVDDEYRGADLDEASLDRLEQEFRAADDDRRTGFGDLEQLDGE